MPPTKAGPTTPSADDRAERRHGSSDQCPDCGEAALSRYCPACGLDKTRGRLRAKDLVSEFLSGITDFERPFWRTFKLLITHPGQTSRAYVEGKRRTYASPIRLVLVFATLSTLAQIVTGGPLQFAGGANLTLSSGHGTPLGDMQRQVYDIAIQFSHFLNLALLPLVALVYAPLYRKCRGYNFVEQLVGVYYAYSVVFFVDWVLTPWIYLAGRPWIHAIFVLVSICYAASFAAAFNTDRWFQGFLKGLLGQVVLLVAAAIVSIAIVLLMPALWMEL